MTRKFVEICLRGYCFLTSPPTFSHHQPLLPHPHLPFTPAYVAVYAKVPETVANEMSRAVSAQVKEVVSAKMYERRQPRNVSGDCFRHFSEDRLRPRAETASNTLAKTAPDALAGTASDQILRKRIEQVVLGAKPKRDDPPTLPFNEAKPEKRLQRCNQ